MGADCFRRIAAARFTSDSLSQYQARLTFDLRCSLRRLVSGNWIGNEAIR
nr:hypothetical protein [Kibdelosporangium sp. MJ126-NF4]CTQ99263.1 hypothetical protein [Kibdelosporangium sp. MJ126-NF4]